MGESMLYVEPIFLQADAGGLPQLKRVIVAAGDRIAMEPSLMESITAIFGSEAAPPEPVTKPPADTGEEVPLAQDIAELIGEAQQHYEKAQQSLQVGDWTGYGNELDALKAVLDKLTEFAVE